MTTGRHTADYEFVDYWRVHGTDEEVWTILDDVAQYPRWWPSTYRKVTVDESDGESNRSRSGSLLAKGWLPYTIRFDYRVLETTFPRGFAFEVYGDLTGRGVFDIHQNGEWVDVTFTWTVRGDKPILRYLSFLLKPLFRSNHSWTMRQGERSLQLELERRRASTPEELERIPAPPGPVSNAGWVVAAAVLVMVLLWTVLRSVKKVTL